MLHIFTVVNKHLKCQTWWRLWGCYFFFFFLKIDHPQIRRIFVVIICAAWHIGHAPEMFGARLKPPKLTSMWNECLRREISLFIHDCECNSCSDEVGGNNAKYGFVRDPILCHESNHSFVQELHYNQSQLLINLKGSVFSPTLRRECH